VILVLVEHEEAAVVPLSLEAVTFARRLAANWGGPVEAVLIGPGADQASAALPEYGVARAHVVTGDHLDTYNPAAWAAGLHDVVTLTAPELVLAAGSDRGHELLAHVGARADVPFVTNAVEIRPGTEFGAVRQCFGGSVLEEVVIDAPVKLLTVAAHIVEAEPSTPGASGIELVEHAASANASDLRARVTRQASKPEGGVSLSDARVVVGGGRGVGGPDGFDELIELAGLLGGTLGVSRVVTGLGWRPHSEQVGQTGTRIAPDLYVACGISGAIQHMAGCQSAKTILAINNDPDAPMVARADYAVIGDLHAIVPALIAELRKSAV
jgi:electron transfer flavoprotein alpha subunit